MTINKIKKNLLQIKGKNLANIVCIFIFLIICDTVKLDEKTIFWVIKGVLFYITEKEKEFGNFLVPRMFYLYANMTTFRFNN